jgi:hypothetical protein
MKDSIGNSLLEICAKQFQKYDMVEIGVIFALCAMMD